MLIRNSQAARLLDSTDSLELNHQDQLSLNNPKLNANLLCQIQQACSTGDTSSEPLVPILVADNNGDNKKVVLNVSSLHTESALVQTDLNFALITLTTTEQSPDIRVEHITALFSLTQAESEVYKLIVNGYSTREIAAARSVQAETIVSQVKSILHKTGSRERLDLVRLLLQTPGL